ncbi:unnamed protein product [Urochloa humidicola]
MSSPNRRRLDHPAGKNMTATAPPPTIPLDPLLDILARTDAATVVRCAATSKPIRRAILDPAFRHAITITTTNFVPAFLLGFSYVHRALSSNHTDEPARVVALQGRPRFDAALLAAFEPVAARGGLVILRQREPAAGAVPNLRELRVCNSLTGDTTILPHPTVQDEYPPALLAVTDAGRSFELLVADRCLRTQTFSTKQGKWSAVVETRLPPRHCYDVPAGSGGAQAHPVVLGAVVHWLCHGGCLHPGVKVLDTGAGNMATQIELPADWDLTRVRCTQRIDAGLLLAKSGDGRLSLLVAEVGAIAMWTLAAKEAGSARWSRQVVIRRQDIGREAVEGPSFSVRFMGFGERSGAVILQMDGIGLVRLDLGSKEAVVLCRGSFEHVGRTDLFQLCLHETDLCSLLQAVKPF